MTTLPVKCTSALLWVSVALFFVACAKVEVAPADIEKQAFEDLRADIRDVIDDPARESEAIRLVGALEQDLADLRARVTARKRRAKELNANYDTPRAELEAFLAGIEAEVRDHKRLVSETHRALLANVTAEEQSAIAKTHTKAMNTAIETIQSI